MRIQAPISFNKVLKKDRAGIKPGPFYFYHFASCVLITLMAVASAVSVTTIRL